MTAAPVRLALQPPSPLAPYPRRQRRGAAERGRLLRREKGQTKLKRPETAWRRGGAGVESKNGIGSQYVCGMYTLKQTQTLYFLFFLKRPYRTSSSQIQAIHVRMFDCLPGCAHCTYYFCDPGGGQRDLPCPTWTATFTGLIFDHGIDRTGPGLARGATSLALPRGDAAAAASLAARSYPPPPPPPQLLGL